MRKKAEYFDKDGSLNSGLAWTLFNLTGETGYYMLYKRLTDDEEES